MPGLWQSRFVVPAAAVGLFLEALEGDEVSVAAFEEPGVDGAAGEFWRIELLHAARPDQRALAGRLAPLAESAGIGRLDLRLAALPHEDWLVRTAAGFPPQRIGRFWVHGSHVSGPPPAATVPLLIDAGLAFGSGEHASTQGCLRLLDGLAARRRFGRVLDLGCGSGILAIAAAKCWPARVLAVDDDPAAVAVAAANAERNGVAHRVRCVHGNGFADPLVRTAGPFDLVLANILADPLCDLARGIARRTAAGGTVILGGLLDRQADAVLATYRRSGLRLLGRAEAEPWVALLLGPTRSAPRTGRRGSARAGGP